MRDYQVGQPLGCAGPADVWRLFSATAKKPGSLVQHVCIWVLAKKELREAAKQQAHLAECDAMLDQQRQGCAKMTRLKIPGVLKVVEPLEETATQLVLVTEALTGSLRHVTSAAGATAGSGLQRTRGGSSARPAGDLSRGGGGGSASVGTTTPSAALSLTEVKLGLGQLADALTLLHGAAGTAHLSLCPETIMVTSGGEFKLGCFHTALVIAAPGPGPSFDYGDPFPAAWDEASQPALSYASPELTRSSVRGAPSHGGSSLPDPAAADAWSLGAVAFELVSGVPLLRVRNSLKDYGLTVPALQSHAGWATIPASLQGVLRSMLQPTPQGRAPVQALTHSPFFTEDLLLSAVRYLDTLLQQDESQKAAFLRDLAQLWRGYDERMLRQRVLPPLLQELRNSGTQLLLIPLIAQIAASIDPADAALLLLPVLQPLMASASGPLQSALLEHLPSLSRVFAGDPVVQSLLPFYLRVLEGDARAQQTALRQLLQWVEQPPVTQTSAPSHGAPVPALSRAVLSLQLIPRLLMLCGSTTSAGVRVGVLALLAKAVTRVSAEDCGKVLDLCQLVTHVDKSANTVLAVSAVAAAAAEQFRAPLAATRLLPLLTPLLLAPGLGPVHFSKLMSTIQNLLTMIQKEVEPSVTGVATHSTTTSSGDGSATAAAAVAGSGLHQNGLATATPSLGSSSWMTQSLPAAANSAWQQPTAASSTTWQQQIASTAASTRSWQGQQQQAKPPHTSSPSASTLPPYTMPSSSMPAIVLANPFGEVTAPSARPAVTLPNPFGDVGYAPSVATPNSSAGLTHGEADNPFRLGGTAPVSSPSLPTTAPKGVTRPTSALPSKPVQQPAAPHSHSTTATTTVSMVTQPAAGQVITAGQPVLDDAFWAPAAQQQNQQAQQQQQQQQQQQRQQQQQQQRQQSGHASSTSSAGGSATPTTAGLGRPPPASTQDSLFMAGPPMSGRGHPSVGPNTCCAAPAAATQPPTMSATAFPAGRQPGSSGASGGIGAAGAAPVPAVTAAAAAAFDPFGGSHALSAPALAPASQAVMRPVTGGATQRLVPPPAPKSVVTVAVQGAARFDSLI
ncbi:MAG: hypothetical protein WDW36_001725 [Sanguina aurantia]